MLVSNNWFIILSFCSTISYSQIEKKDSIKNSLKEVTVKAKNSISEKFSVAKIEKLDIYFNPISNGDPLKAITILPASTNINETANPVLRGGDADRTRVFINGCPVLNPVRNSQDNGLGSFSLFNTEIIDKQYVYASNPPLTFGNSSAGIVEIETNKKLSTENLQVSLSLSSFGFLLNKNLGNARFIQVYANHQFSNFFLGLNKNNSQNHYGFMTNDLGLNAHVKLNNKLFYNSFNYGINEKNDTKNYRLNFSGDSNSNQKRFFSINSIEYFQKKSKFKLSTLLDFSDQNYNYGVINSSAKYFQFFSNLSHKYQISNKSTFQYGFDYSISKYNYNEVKPTYYFALENGSQTYFKTEIIKFQFIEPYIYCNYEFSNNFGASSAIRKNLPINGEPEFTSLQFATHYEFNRKNRFILSAGQYHSYTSPNVMSHEISLLSSFQAAFDYYYSAKNFQLNGALYYKKDAGNYVISVFENFDNVKTIGLEISSNFNVTKKISVGFSNSYVNQKITTENKEFNSNLNLKYFIKSQLSYIYPKLFTASLAFTTRPGSFFTDVVSTTFNANANATEPIFGELNNNSFGNYSKLDFTINKIFQFKNYGLISYLSLNNILNTKNQSSINYNHNYSESFYNYYQQRIIYFGFQFRLNCLINK